MLDELNEFQFELTVVAHHGFDLGQFRLPHSSPPVNATGKNDAA
jgi:hypothetical protein